MTEIVLKCQAVSVYYYLERTFFIERLWMITSGNSTQLSVFNQSTGIYMMEKFVSRRVLATILISGQKIFQENLTQ